MNVLKKLIILIAIVIATIFNTVNIIATKEVTANAATTTLAEYYDTQTQTQYVNNIPIEVFVSYKYNKDNYNIKEVTSISSVTASIHSSEYAGSVSEYHYLNGNSISVTVYGSAHTMDNFSDTINIYRTFSFNIF